MGTKVINGTTVESTEADIYALSVLSEDEEKVKAHNKAILEHLQSGRTITGLEALKKYGCSSCAARIYDLKRAGVQIISRTRVLDNKKRVAEYELAK